MQRKWRRRWRRLAKMLLPPVAAGMLLLSAYNPAYANPSGGTVTNGAATIATNGSTMTVNQATNKAIINWQSFSIGSGETVNFIQPGATAIALNRVVGNNASTIYGTLTANGKVYLINPSGILFSSSAQVNVGGLAASTLNISDSDFLNGKYVFSGSGNGSVVNKGTITATNEAVLIGPRVANDGVIAAKVTGLMAGNQVSLDFAGDQLLSLAVDTGAAGGSATNSGTITANGGLVVMSAGTADTLLGTVVNNSGVIQARTITNEGGVIKLLGNTVNVAGTLDASAPIGGNGGFIETSGSVVNVAPGAKVSTLAAAGKTGTWLIDPNDFTIAASGGNMTGAAVADNLATTNFEIQTATMGTAGGNGDIFVNDAITWGSNHTLTLTAQRNVNVNKAITANGDSAGLILNAGNNINISNAVTFAGANGTLAMNYGGDYNIRTKASYSGAVIGPDGWPAANTDTSGGVYGSITFTNSGNTNGLTINGQNYTLIYSMAGLATTGTLTGPYALAQDLDAASWSSDNTGKPSVVATLSGTLAGLGHTVSNLTINAPTTPNAGLVGQTTANSVIRDLGLVNASVTGKGSVGTLLGVGTNTTIKNAYATGTATSTAYNGTTTAPGTGGNTGGLVGRLQGGSISSSYTDVAVEGWASVGGLVGLAQINGAVGMAISNSHAAGAVIGKGGNVGGLVGSLQTGSAAASGSIAYSYATGNVTNVIGGNYQGGLVGQVGYYNSISYSFAMGNVSAGGTSEQVGGLVGLNYGYLDHVYARGDVSAYKKVGGLVGVNMVNPNNSLGGIIGYAYAAGKVTGLEVVGGFAGESGLGTRISDSYATGAVSTGAGGIGGGFIGANHGIIERCYATGNVTGVGLIGGFAGINQAVGTISDSYATGSVDGNNNSDKFAGEDDGTRTNSTWHDAPAEAAYQVTVEATASQTASSAGQAAQQQSASITEAYAGTLTNQPGQAGGGDILQNQADASGTARISSVEVDGVNYQTDDDKDRKQ